MDYKLSEKNDNKKKQYESKIEQNNKKYIKLREEIKNIRAGKSANKIFAILELQIQQEEIERDTLAKETAIADLYLREMEENLKQRKINKEISTQEFLNEKHNIQEYRSMNFTNSSIESYDMESTILQMKIKLEHMKKELGKVSKEQADKNISEMEQTLSDNEKYRQDEFDELAKQNFEYKRRNLYYQRDIGEITNEELKQKENELVQKKDEIPSDKELKQIFDGIATKHLQERDKEQTDEPYEKKTGNFENKISARGEEEKTHYFNLEDRHYSYTENELSEKYSRHLKGEEKELATMFAHFQKEKNGFYFEDEYDTELQRIEEYKDIDGETYYTIIYRGRFENNGIVQTYTKDENGKLELYSEKEYDDFYHQVMSNYQNECKSFSLNDANIKMQKALIEDALGKEQVTEITEIIDSKFLEDFAKQLGQGEGGGGLYNATIISSINEKGEEDYDIIFTDYANMIMPMPGIKALNKDRNNIHIDTGMSIPTQDGKIVAKIYDSITNLKEFETQDGHRYAISRDSKGKLGFTEIYKENEHSTFGKNVNTYTFEDLKETYRTKKINQTDLNKAFDTINRTKQQQTKGEMNFETEGR